MPLAMLRLARFLVLFVLVALTWTHAGMPPPDSRQLLQVDSILPRARMLGLPDLGPFTLTGAWRLSSSNTDFGGYSALVAMPGGKLLAIGDQNGSLLFSPPGEGRPIAFRIDTVVKREGRTLRKVQTDAEAATRDPVTGAVWIAYEARNGLARYDSWPGKDVKVRVPAMEDWSQNTGPEAMTRLADGRWLVLSEAFSTIGTQHLHPGFMFPGLPDRTEPEPLELALPAGFRPTDAATLPDGRILVLGRRLRLLPPRFNSMIALADPRDYVPGKPWSTRWLAGIDGWTLRENYEGMTVTAKEDGSVLVWLISDANASALQETRLLRLEWNPAKIPTTPLSQE